MMRGGLEKPRQQDFFEPPDQEEVLLEPGFNEEAARIKEIHDTKALNGGETIKAKEKGKKSVFAALARLRKLKLEVHRKGDQEEMNLGD